MMCSHWPDGGGRCRSAATVALCAPDGEPIPAPWHCKAHADAIVSEYAEKLGQRWSTYAVDEYGREVPIHKEAGRA